MQIHGSVANDMLRNISDPGLRETYGNILSGKFKYKVYCLKPQINPDTKKPFHASKCAIGFVTRTNKIIDACTSNKKGQPIAGIETSRDRFDGRKGFRCYCGNWSIQCEEEYGVLKTSVLPTPPTQEDLLKIADNLKKSGKQQLHFVDGWAEYDGFGLEEVSA